MCKLVYNLVENSKVLESSKVHDKQLYQLAFIFVEVYKVDMVAVEDVSQLNAYRDRLKRELDKVEQAAEHLRDRISLCESQISRLSGTQLVTTPASSTTVKQAPPTLLFLKRGKLREHIQQSIYLARERGSSVADLRHFILLRHGIDVQPNTISVALNRLKKDRLVRVEGKHWYPDVPPEDDTVADSYVVQAADLDDEEIF